MAGGDYFLENFAHRGGGGDFTGGKIYFYTMLKYRYRSAYVSCFCFIQISDATRKPNSSTKMEGIIITNLKG